MPYLRLRCLLLLFVLFSCSSPPDPPEHPVTDHELLAETGDTAVEAEAEPTATHAISFPDSAALQQYAIDTTGLAPEPDMQVKLLLEGVFHKQEVWQGAEKKSWLGLFDNNGSYELRPTNLEIKPAFDPVADARTEITTGRKVISGREVRGTDDNVMLFITGIRNIKAGPVDTASFSKKVIRPGKELLLSFKRKDFRLTAFGDSSQLESGEYSYQNYGWKIAGTVKGKKLEQVLAQDELFLNSIYMLHWAGDIDRDGVPDLVAELSNHFNLSRTALFLSAGAEKGKIYKKPVLFETAGR